MRLLSILFIVFTSSSAPSKVDNWISQQKEISLKYLLKNISRDDTPRGFVVASPSKSDPNYYYHWVRDAALVMSALDKHLPDGSEKEELFIDYIDLVLHHQSADTLTGLGEPKFNTDGSGYSEPWGRPQNDGPALRAIALIRFTEYLLDQGEYDLVEAKLYNSDFPATTAIKRDLEYVSHQWQEPDFDLWEEVKGTHFYTRMVQRTALHLGARLASRLEDEGAAEWYAEQAELISEELEEHWSEEDGYILSTINRVGGLDYKSSNLDTSVILAVNHAWVPGLSFGPDDERVENTFDALEEAFYDAYPINYENDNADLGLAIGRYPEDTYFGGNPWFLLTNAMAEYLFKLGRDDEAHAYLLRTKKHLNQSSGRMDEQFSKYNGYMIGAYDLTWSYASFLTVIQDDY